MFTSLRSIWIKHFRRHAIPDSNGFDQVKPRSIYILPTKQGVILALILMLMLIGSVNYGSNLGYLVTFLLGAIWLTTILHTWRNLLGLRVRPVKANPVFAGEQAVFELQLFNPDNLARYAINLQTPQGNRTVHDMPGTQTQDYSLSILAPSRGHLTLSEVSIYSQYPYGLFKAWTYISLQMQCLVYPRPAQQGEPPTEAYYCQSESGELGVGADDFIGLRSFRSGDSPRHIDWKAMARERGLYCKQFGGDRSDRLSLDWEQLDEPDQEQRLSLLCRFILLAESRQQQYDLKLPGIEIAPALNEQHRQRCLATLACYKTGQ